MDRTTIGLHCYIHANSVGWGEVWTRTATRLGPLAEFCGVDERTIQKTVSSQEAEETINRKKTDGGYKYSRPRRIDYDGEDTWGQCNKCKEATPFKVDRNIPIPHTLFLNVFRATERGVFLSTLYIATRTFRGSKDGQLHVHPCPISIDDFKKGTGLQKSELEADLKKGEEVYHLFQSSGKRGAVQTYWVTPENWSNLDIKPKRVGGNPSPIKRGRKSEVSTTVEPQPKQGDTKTTSPPEFWFKPCGVCLKCSEWSVINVVPAPENPVKRPLARSREGPPPPVWSDLPTLNKPLWKKEA
jgi:hypothetical protein